MKLLAQYQIPIQKLASLFLSFLLCLQPLPAQNPSQNAAGQNATRAPNGAVQKLGPNSLLVWELN